MIFNISKITLLASLNIINILASLAVNTSGIEPDFKIDIKIPAKLPIPRKEF